MHKKRKGVHELGIVKLEIKQRPTDQSEVNVSKFLLDQSTVKIKSHSRDRIERQS